MAQTNEDEATQIAELWQEHLAAPFPAVLRGRDVNGIDFVLLGSDIAGCVTTFLERDKLSVRQTATLGIAYRNAGYVVPVLYEQGASHFWRLERLAELILKRLRSEHV